jgi:hypothetical protein
MRRLQGMYRLFESQTRHSVERDSRRFPGERNSKTRILLMSDPPVWAPIEQIVCGVRGRNPRPWIHRRPTRTSGRGKVASERYEGGIGPESPIIPLAAALTLLVPVTDWTFDGGAFSAAQGVAR